MATENYTDTDHAERIEARLRGMMASLVVMNAGMESAAPPSTEVIQDWLYGLRMNCDDVMHDLFFMRRDLGQAGAA